MQKIGGGKFWRIYINLPKFYIRDKRIMALLKYLKPITGTLKNSLDETLPHLDSYLSQVVPSSAIAKANETVTQALEQSKNGERGPYLKLTPAQRYQVGKRAAEHGITAFIRYFKTKFN